MFEKIQPFLFPLIVTLWIIIVAHYVKRYLADEEGEEETEKESSASEREAWKDRVDEFRDWLEVKREKFGPYWWKVRFFSFPFSFLLVLWVSGADWSVGVRVVSFLLLELFFSQWLVAVLQEVAGPHLPGHPTHIEKDPEKKTYWSALLSTGRDLASAGEYEKALSSFEQALKLTPENTEVLYLVGACHYQLGRDEKARAAWKKILRLDPGHSKAEMWLDELEALRQTQPLSNKLSRLIRKTAVLVVTFSILGTALVFAFLLVDPRLSPSETVRRNPEKKSGPSPVPLVSVKNEKPAGNLEEEPYRDLKGYFEITPPEGWRVQPFKQDPRGKVVFIGPNATIKVLVEPKRHKNLRELEDFLSWEGKQSGLNTLDSSKTTFQGHEALERIYAVPDRRFFEIRFLTRSADHSLVYSAPPDGFEKSLPLAKKTFETYTPLR